MAQFVIFRSDELYHHGIKGQRWGIRRFQNDDGSLTSEGYEHYGVSKKEQKREAKEMNSLMKNAKKAFNNSTRAYQLSKLKKIQDLADDDLKEKYKKQSDLHNKVYEADEKRSTLERKFGIGRDDLDGWDPETGKENYGIDQKQYNQIIKVRSEYNKSKGEYEKAYKEFRAAQRAKTQSFVKDYMSKPYSKVKYSKENEEKYANYVARVLDTHLEDFL